MFYKTMCWMMLGCVSDSPLKAYDKCRFILLVLLNTVDYQRYSLFHIHITSTVSSTTKEWFLF